MYCLCGPPYQRDVKFGDKMSHSQKAHCQYLCFIFKGKHLECSRTLKALCCIFKGKHLECSRTLKAYWSDIYRTFINFPYIFKIGKISPVTLPPRIIWISWFNRTKGRICVLKILWSRVEIVWLFDLPGELITIVVSCGKPGPRASRKRTQSKQLPQKLPVERK